MENPASAVRAKAARSPKARNCRFSQTFPTPDGNGLLAFESDGRFFSSHRISSRRRFDTGIPPDCVRSTGFHPIRKSRSKPDSPLFFPLFLPKPLPKNQDTPLPDFQGAKNRNFSSGKSARNLPSKADGNTIGGSTKAAHNPMKINSKRCFKIKYLASENETTENIGLPVRVRHEGLRDTRHRV